jgi:hypothetical protein
MCIEGECCQNPDPCGDGCVSAFDISGKTVCLEAVLPDCPAPSPPCRKNGDCLIQEHCVVSDYPGPTRLVCVTR